MVDAGFSPSGGVRVLLLSVAVGTDDGIGEVGGCTDKGTLDAESDEEGEVDGTRERRGLGRGAGRRGGGECVGTEGGWSWVSSSPSCGCNTGSDLRLR